MGCCQSAPRAEYQNSPYAPSNGYPDSSSRAIANNPSNLATTSNSHIAPGRQSAEQSHPRHRRHLAPGEHFNAPIRPHVWTSSRPWRRSELDRERQEFFETRVTGRPEIWETLKAVVNLVAEGDIATAQSILDAAAITVPTGDLKNGVYDEVGNLYQMPEHIISDPQNLILDPPKDLAGETSVAPSDDDEEIERRREEKGKSVLNTGNLIEVKARLSDRGGPDAIVTMERDQNVRVLSRRIEEEILGKGKVRIAYMGKMLKDGESLSAQGWREGHVVNALVFP